MGSSSSQIAGDRPDGESDSEKSSRSSLSSSKMSRTKRGHTVVEDEDIPLPKTKKPKLTLDRGGTETNANRTNLTEGLPAHRKKRTKKSMPQALRGTSIMPASQTALAAKSSPSDLLSRSTTITTQMSQEEHNPMMQHERPILNASPNQNTSTQRSLTRSAGPTRQIETTRSPEEPKRAAQGKPPVKSKTKPSVQPQASPPVEPRATSKAKPQVKPQAKPQAKPQVKPQTKPQREAQTSPQAIQQNTPQGTPRTTITQPVVELLNKVHATVLDQQRAAADRVPARASAERASEAERAVEERPARPRQKFVHVVVPGEESVNQTAEQTDRLSSSQVSSRSSEVSLSMTPARPSQTQNVKKGIAKPKPKFKSTPKATQVDEDREDNDAGGRGSRKGAWTAQEKALADAVFNAYCTEKKLDPKRLKYMIMQWGVGDMEEVRERMYEAFLTRNKPTIRKFCQRRYQPYNTGPWTSAEDEDLKAQIKALGNKWTEISEHVERAPEACRDRWKNILSYGDDLERGPWSIEEEAALRANIERAIAWARQEFKNAKTDEPESYEKIINWHVVSEETGGRRSAKRCQEKWNILKKRDMMDDASPALQLSGATATITTPPASQQTNSQVKIQKALDRAYRRLGWGDVEDALHEICRATDAEPDRTYEHESTFWSTVTLANAKSRFPTKVRRRCYEEMLKKFASEASVTAANGIGGKAHAVSKLLRRMKKSEKAWSRTVPEKGGELELIAEGD